MVYQQKIPLQEARNIEDFLENFKDDPTVKIPRVYKQLSGSRVLVMEWIDGIRCTDPQVLNAKYGACMLNDSGDYIYVLTQLFPS